ncbi:MAG TPA: hypothetical protein VF808_16525 [Ktedonobacterales bacterium]
MRRIPASMSARAARAAGRPLWLAALSLLLVGAAACGHLTTSQPGQGASDALTRVSMGGIGCLAPAKPSPAGGCVTTDAATGISARVTDAYADVTGTLVHLVAANTYNYPLMLNGQLALKSGYVLLGANGGFGSTGETLIGDEPLPPQDFAPRVEIIATATLSPPVSFGLAPPTYPPAPPWLNRLDRIAIRVPFTLSPPRWGGFTYHQPPVVEQGIGVQVQILDVSPTHESCVGEAGGARVELRFTGLPADLELLSFIRVQSQRASNGSACYGGGTGSSGDNGPGLFELHIPGMTLASPVMTLLQSPQWPTGGNQTSEQPVVGPAGTVQFEVAFLGSGAPNGQPATLTISSIQRLTGGADPLKGTYPSLPTYQITLPMR